MQLLQWCHDIAAAMSYLSGKSFIHRDLAARNILLNKKKQCKVSNLEIDIQYTYIVWSLYLYFADFRFWYGKKLTRE